MFCLSMSVAEIAVIVSAISRRFSSLLRAVTVTSSIKFAESASSAIEITGNAKGLE